VTGKTLRQLVANELADPLEADFFFGLDEPARGGEWWRPWLLGCAY
jgi:hypothetical protein